MSAVSVATRPVPTREPRRSAPPLEVVTTRTQRRARPRAVYAAAGVLGVFAILLAQLMLSIVLSDGAYRITALEAQQLELDRTAQSLGESLNVLDSAQHLAANAESLGMVVSTTTPTFLLLSDASVQGTPRPAGSGGGILEGRDTYVGNVLLTDVPLVALTTTAGGASLAESGVAAAPSSSGSLPSASGGIPSPDTR